MIQLINKMNNKIESNNQARKENLTKQTMKLIKLKAKKGKK